MESISRLRVICQQQKKVEQGESKSYFFHRKISIYLTWLLLHTSITANQVTLLGLLISGLGCLLIIPLDIKLNVFGFLVCYLGFLMDKVDGEVARYRHCETSTGLLLDEIWHLVFPFLFFFSLSLNIYLSYQNIGVFILGTILAFLSVLIRFSTRLSPLIFIRTLLVCKNKDQLRNFINNIKAPAQSISNWHNRRQECKQNQIIFPLRAIFYLRKFVYIWSVRFVSAIFVFFIVFLLEEAKNYFPIGDFSYKIIFINFFFAVYLLYFLERIFLNYSYLKNKLVSLNDYFQTFYSGNNSKLKK